MSFFLLFRNQGVVVTSPATGTADGKRRRGKKRRYSSDEELSEAEVQYMMRKIAELKAAKTAREKLQAQKQIEDSLATISQEHPDAAAAISEAATSRQGQGTAAKDFRLLSRDLLTLDQITDKLAEIAKAAAQEQRRLRDESDIEFLVMSL